MYCLICETEFFRQRKSRRVTCSKSCAVALSWHRGDTRERRSASILAAKQTPQGIANQRRANETRWADPEQHERLRQKNIARWSDHTKRAAYGALMRKFNGQPEERAKASVIRRNWWEQHKCQ